MREKITGSTKKKILFSLTIILLSVAFYLISYVNFPVIDSKADNYFTNAIKKATISYATARGVNAVVSFLKDSEIEITPAGVGINIAAGEILDPLDDMTERLSTILVIAIVSLGIQKIAMEIGFIVSFKMISILLPLFILPLWLKQNFIKSILSPAIKIIAILFVLRLFLPISSIIDNFAYQQFFEQGIEDTRAKLTEVSDNYKQLCSFENKEYNGLWSKMKGVPHELETQAVKIRKVFSSTIGNMGIIIDSLLKLIMLYVTMFLLQVIIIPLFMLWLLLKIVDKIFTKNFENKFIANLKGKEPVVAI